MAIKCCCCSFHLCSNTDSSRIWRNPYNGMVRLSRGSYTSEGLVEVYCKGQWGTVCDNGFSSTDANTVCKQLGYARAVRYDHLTSLWVNLARGCYCSKLLLDCNIKGWLDEHVFVNTDVHLILQLQLSQLAIFCVYCIIIVVPAYSMLWNVKIIYK